MDDLKSNIQNLCKKLELLDNFCDLQLRKGAIQTELKELRGKAENVKKLLEETKELYEKLPDLKIQFQQRIEKIKNQHIMVLNLLLEIKQMKLKEIPPAKSILSTPIHGNIPRMYLSEYVNSPYVKYKGRQKQIEFINFEFKINPAAFDLIPKYMRGRQTLDELQQFLNDIVTPCLNEKYQLIHKKREAIKNAPELEIWKSYNLQSNLFPNKNFVTQEDVARKINKSKLLDRISLSKFTMLRHLGIVQIEQKGQTVCYIWIEK